MQQRLSELTLAGLAVMTVLRSWIPVPSLDQNRRLCRVANPVSMNTISLILMTLDF